MANREYLLELQEEYSEEIERLRERMAKLEQALGGVRIAIELEAEKEERRDAVDRSPRVRLDGESFKEVIISEAQRRSGEFTAPELYEDLRRQYPDREVNSSTVSHALRAAAERGAIVVVEKGAGKRPTRYAVPQGALNLNGKETGAETEEVPTP